MVFGFIKHVSEYFTSKKRKRKNRADSDSEEDRKKRPFQANGWIPLYDPNGQVVGYVQPGKSQTSDMKLSTPRPVTSVQEKGLVQPYTAQIPVSAPNPQPSVTHKKSSSSLHDLNWDGWPNGQFERDFNLDEVRETKHLQVHWACLILGGSRKGNPKASSWQNGKKSTRRCLGVLECDNPECEIVLRPQSSPKRIKYQLDGFCKCGGELIHKDCGVRSNLWTWAGGIHYEHEGYHEHNRPAYILHLLKDQQRRFEALVQSNPKVGPLGLMMGVPGINGPGESVTEISDVLLNGHRVGKERLKLVSSKSLDGDDFVARFAQFDRDHPGFIISSQIGEVTVISLQSSLMRSQLLREQDLDGPINGMVNDAAHGWWKKRSSLLMISSTYCPALLCWVPGVMSFVNGATAEHFKCHFLAVFESIEAEAKKRGIPITDLSFRGVMDFSDAERQGFILAFVLFWTNRQDPRSVAELKAAAAALLRGCHQHFRNNVTRISRISAVVPPDQAESFKARANALLKAPDSVEFLARVKLLLKEYPGVESWLAWYMRPAHAQMLFSSQRTMDIAIWDSMPDTTNAEEAMHWKLYAGLGRDHTLFEGLECLWKAAFHYDQQYSAVRRGVPIRHGQPEIHKIIAKHTGTTKPSRRKLSNKQPSKSDGRGPDTSKELCKAIAKKRKLESEDASPRKRAKVNSNSKAALKLPKPTASSVVKFRATSLSSEYVSSSSLPTDPLAPQSARGSVSPPASDDPLGSPSYPWANNSCWLDTSLQLFHVAFLHMGFNDFDNLCKGLPDDSGIRLFHSAILERRSLPHSLPNGEASRLLKRQRDTLRRELSHRRASRPYGYFDSLTVWLTELVARDARKDISFRQSLFFGTLLIDIHDCSGSTQTGGRHIEITSIPRRKNMIQVSDNTHQEYNGSITHYMDHFFGINLPSESKIGRSCWRSREGIPLCSGERINHLDMVISVPVILIIENGCKKNSPPWDFPATIYPHGSGNNISDIVYDLAGLGLTVNDRQHFIARYASRDGNKVYTYDGMKDSGCPTVEINATAETHLFGRNVTIPEGAEVHQAFYYLRGGLEAQEQFYEQRVAALCQTYPLTISRDLTTGTISIAYQEKGLVPMDKKERYWMTDPYRDGKTEYLSRNTPKATHAQKNHTPEPEDTLEPDSSPNHSPESVQQPPSSLPDSLFSLNCRCGMTGDGNIAYLQDDGEAIQCDRCKDWSHVACQRDGRADMLRKNQAFLCDSCNLAVKRTSKRNISKSKNLAQRLRAGCTVLVQQGVYWYPARLIQREENGGWRVRWWRGCNFEEPSVNPGSMARIQSGRIVDSLWQNRAERRKIRLGIWSHALSPMSEDILSDPSLISYTPEVDLALAPSVKILQQLLTHPEQKVQ